MLRLIRQHATYGNVTATLALFVALGGSAYAVAQLPAGSVGSRQLKNNAVTTSKIKNNAVRTSKIRNSAVTGAKVRRNSLTGADINESSLGQVPSALAANTATTATNATNATNANHANTATTATRSNAIGLVAYRSFNLPLPASATPTALIAPCNPGQHVIGGGVQLALPATEEVIDQFPATGNTGWTVRLTNTGMASTVTVYAICTAVATTGT
jgi:hypothetical protein